jgi:hypothetical protein
MWQCRDSPRRHLYNCIFRYRKLKLPPLLPRTLCLGRNEYFKIVFTCTVSAVCLRFGLSRMMLMDVCYTWYGCAAESPATESASFGKHEFPVVCDRRDGMQSPKHRIPVTVHSDLRKQGSRPYMNSQLF